MNESKGPSMQDFRDFLVKDEVQRGEKLGLTQDDQLYYGWVDEILTSIYQSGPREKPTIHFFFSNDKGDEAISINTTSENRGKSNNEKLYLKLCIDKLPEKFREKIVKNGIRLHSNKQESSNSNNKRPSNVYQLQRLIVAIDQDIINLYIHHIDVDTLNNNRNNLVALTWEEHKKLHNDKTLNKLTTSNKEIVEEYLKCLNDNPNLTLESFCEDYKPQLKVKDLTSWLDKKKNKEHLTKFQKETIEKYNEKRSIDASITPKTFCLNFEHPPINPKELGKWIKAYNGIVVTETFKRGFIKEYKTRKDNDPQLTQRQFCKDYSLYGIVVNEKDFSKWLKEDYSDLSITKKSKRPLTSPTKFSDDKILDILNHYYNEDYQYKKYKDELIAKKLKISKKSVNKYAGVYRKYSKYLESIKN